MSAELPAAVAETHTAWLFLVGDRAYKLKKPVDLGFLDFSTREARQRACADEVALNRRLAPDVYLGVADVRGPDGEWCDHLVVMRRMPAEARLGRLARDGLDIGADVDRIAELVAAFHARCEVPADAAVLGGAELLARRWEDGLRTLAAADAVPAEDVEQSRRLALRYLAGRGPLLAARAAAGRVRDGHGDLLADDIFCLPDGPRVLDCLEFDRALRVCDVLADIGFLAMDLEHLGAAVAARRLLDRYAEVSGDEWPRSLEDHYLAYRAHIRAKVSAIRAGQVAAPEERAAAVRAARALTAQSLRHLSRARVRLVLVGGLPGTGKSTVAGEVGRRAGWPVLSSDVVRKELAGLPPTAPAPADVGAGLYTAERTAATYRMLLERAARLLAAGESVVVDASFTDPAWRSAAAAAAEGVVVDLVEVRTVAAEAVALQRIRGRRPGSGASDATPAVHAAMAAAAAPWPSATAVSTEGPPEAAVEAVLRLAGAEPVSPPERPARR